MIFNKKEVDYKNKKHLLVIFILMIIAAIGLMIANIFDKERGVDTEKTVNINESNTSIGSQSYSAVAIPELRSDDKVLGNKEAKLKIFVYEDYDDLFSAKLTPTIDRLIREKGDKIAIVLRPFIGLSFKSAEHALALDCVNNNWQNLRREIMLSVENKSGEELSAMIKKVGIKENDFFNCLEEKKQSNRINEIKEDTLNFQVFGTPTLFVGNELVLGARPYENYVDSNGDQVEGLNSLINRILQEK